MKDVDYPGMFVVFLFLSFAMFLLTSAAALEDLVERERAINNDEMKFINETKIDIDRRIEGFEGVLGRLLVQQQADAQAIAALQTAPKPPVNNILAWCYGVDDGNATFMVRCEK